MLHDLPREAQDPDDPAVFINTDIRNAFQEMSRQTSFDTLMGVATQTYDGGRVQPGDTIPTISELEPFLGYFWAMHSTECTNRFTDHCGRTHHVTATDGGQQGDGLEMGRYSLSQHPIWGRVLARHERARGAAFADDSYIYATLKAALQVLAEIRQRLWEDAKLSFNMSKVKIYIPGVSRERARELVLQHIDSDPSLESLRQLYDLDTADPDLGIINVTGLKCVGVPIGTPEFVDAFVRSKIDDIQHDVQKLRIIQDPKIHYDLLRFCQHTRIAFLARNVPPDVMMKHSADNPAAPILVQDAIVQAILQRGLGDTYNTLPEHVLEWCRTIVELPHHEGGLAITPLQASGMAAFYSATANLVAWLQTLPHASKWVAGQNLADPNTWTSSALQALKQLHGHLLQQYNCKEWVPPPNANAPAPGAPELDDNARPLSLPPLNLLASLRVRQDVENGDAGARPSLPMQRRVTKQIMSEWDRHQIALRNPPTDRMRAVHTLHITQSVPVLAENSALRHNMPQREDAEGGNPQRLSFSPAATVWGQMGRAWTSGDRNARTTELVTPSDYVAFFHQYFGITNNPALAPFANVPCGCQRYFLGGEGAWDHVNTCLTHASNWTRAHNHVLTALESICNSAGYATKHKHVLTSAGKRRADLEILNIQVARNIDLLVDITLRHDFVGAGHNGLNQGQLRNPDHPDKLLDSAAADKIRHYRAPYRQNRHVAFLPACMTTSGRIHGEFLRLIYFISNKQALDYFEALGYDAHKEEFCHRRGVFFHNHRCTLGMACAQAVAMRGAPSAARRLVAAPRNQPPFRFDPHVFERDFSHFDVVV
jgi:hypothetical protein